MNSSRRTFIRQAGNTSVIALLVANGFLRPECAQAELWNKAAFEATSLQDVLAHIVDGPRGDGAGITITAPDIAENGAVVPVGVVATNENIESIAIICEKNPQPLAAIYDIPPGTLADVNTRVKMVGTSNVIVLVKAAGTFYMASRQIKVTRGGCG